MKSEFIIACICIVAVQCLEGTYQNPVVETLDLPDPGVYYEDGTFYAATTSFADPDSFPIRSSSDLVNWTLEGYIFPRNSPGRPKWAGLIDYWAPEIHFVAGRHIAVFALRDLTGLLCVGAAYSTSGVLGPYMDIGRPLVRDPAVGNIDPTIFFNDQTHAYYLAWKEDGNGRVPPESKTPIWAQRLGPDGLSLVGDKIMLLENDLPWENNLVEAPWMVKYSGLYYLFYSANAYYNSSYAVGVARSTSPLGPFTKAPLPLVHSNSIWAGPGHCSVVVMNNTLRPTELAPVWVMVYHSWRVPDVGGPDDHRLLMTDVLLWKGGWPILATGTDSPSVGPEPIP